MSKKDALYFNDGEIILNKYKVIQHLGSGNFGQVYKVYNYNTQNESAIKIVKSADPANDKRLMESQIQGLCRHDHIVKVVTADVLPDCLLIEMEYVEGGTLSSALTSSFISTSDCVKYIKDILYALEHAHDRGFVHRDVKPDNIMLTPRAAKLSDFGTALHMPTGERVTDQFYRPHAAPEAFNHETFSPSSDIYATGLTLQRCVNNTPVWGAIKSDRGSFDLILAQGTLSAKLGFRLWVPRRLKLIINKACNADALKRYQSALQMRQALESLRFARRWTRVDSNSWICGDLEKVERVFYSSKNGHAVGYTVNNRRKMKYCKSFNCEKTAKIYMEKLIADLTLH